MKIAQIATVEECVPPVKFGGVELIVSGITEELVHRGHEVTLFATGDSTTKAKLVPLVPRAIRVITPDIGQEKLRESWKYLALANIIKKLKKENFDIIHQHVGWRMTPIEEIFDSPTVATCHSPLSHDYIQLVYGQFPQNNYITISNAQRNPMPNLNFVATVYNGIDLKHFTYSPHSQNYFAFLARMSPQKGPKEAIIAAKGAGVKLKMASKIDAVDKLYYAKEVEPLVDSKTIEHVGEIGQVEKDKFLNGAKGLLAPIQWEEPFGLFFIEAMACGTPVVTFSRGSVPEIIKDGETGFIVNASDSDKRGNWIVKRTGIEGLKEAIELLERMPEKKYRAMRKACREHVEKNFTVEKMVDGYEKVYQKVINRGNV